jgi:SAM-dependent methyltransferase
MARRCYEGERLTLMAAGLPDSLLAAFRKDDERNSEVYSGLLNAHGDGYKAFNWGSAEGQRRRFAIIAEIGIGHDDSVLDVGCGNADFLTFLRDLGYRGKYHGIDLTPAMVALARERFPDIPFSIGTVLDQLPLVSEQFDYVVASGIFVGRTAEPLLYLSLTATRMFAACRRGVAFNTLSTFANKPADSGEFHASPGDVLETCRKLTPFFVLRHDYHPGDFTVYLRRSAARCS